MLNFRLISVAVALVAVAGIGSATSAWSGETAAKDNEQPRSARSRFTEKMYRDAVPMPLPEVEAPDSAIVPPSPRKRGIEGRSQEAPANPHGVLTDELELQLYDRLDPQEPAADEDSRLPRARESSRDLVFTHSRVFPNEALRIFPYRVAGKLFIQDDEENKTFECSAGLIQRRLVLTAAHCLYDFDQVPPRFLDDFEFVPAFDRGAAPFGRWDWQRVIVTQSWVDGDGTFPHPADFGIVILRDQRIGRRTRAIGDRLGWFGFRTFDAEDRLITALGYPGNLDDGERLQRTDAQSVGGLRSNTSIEIGTFQAGGASGGPWVINFGITATGQASTRDNRIVGVNSFRRGKVGEALINGSSILNDEFFDIFNSACDRAAGNCER